MLVSWTEARAVTEAILRDDNASAAARMILLAFVVSESRVFIIGALYEGIYERK